MQLPPSPQAPPLVQMLQWIVGLGPMSYMEACSKRYGDCFTLRLGEKFAPRVFVSNPQALQQILTSDTKEFEAPGELNRLFRRLLGERVWG